GDQVEVHVVRGAQGVGDDVGAVLGGQRPLDPVVDGVGRLLVAEADEGELLGADHAGGDLDDPDLLAVELQAEGAGEHVLARLRGVVSGAAGIRLVGGDGGHEEHVAAPAAAQGGQQRPGHAQGAEHVGLVHPLPPAEVRLGDRIDAEGTAGDVDDGVELLAEQLVRPLGERGDGCIVGTSTPRVAQPVSSASACSRSSRRATARTCQPSATRRRAVARPMPDEAPVTTAVRGVEGSVASWVLGEVMASQYAEHVPGCTTAAGAGAAAPLWSSAQVARLARVSTYRSVAAAAFRQYSTYRMATAAGVFTNVVFGFIRASILFAAIGGPGGELSGYTIAQAATYVWLGQALLAPIEAFGTRE